MERTKVTGKILADQEWERMKKDRMGRHCTEEEMKKENEREVGHEGND